MTTVAVLEHRGSIYAMLENERARQESLKLAGKFDWSLSDLKSPRTGLVISPSEKLVVLAEEFGEVSKVICESLAARQRALVKHQLRAELVQVAACCVAWIEALEAER